MSRRRRAALVAVAACLVVGAAGGWWWRSRPEPRPAHPPGQAGLRSSLLVDLRDRLVPSSAGGWVAESPGEPFLEGWLLAASQEREPGGSYDRALAEAERTLGRDPQARSLVLVLAEVLPGPTADPGRADRLAREVLSRTTNHLAAGDATWLAPLLQLSAGTSSRSAAASGELRQRTGPVGCDRLPPPDGPLPAPGTSLTVALRVLAATGDRCDRARDLLEAALDDPAWDGWPAAAELADLAEVAGPDPASVRSSLAERFDRWLVVGPDQPIDLVAVVQVQAARARLGLDTEVEGPLAAHLRGQVAHRGSLPGRSTSAPSAFDVAILRQLAGSGLVPDSARRATVASRADVAVGDPVDPVVDALLAGRDPIRCGDAPAEAPERRRVSLDGLVADQAWATVREACADRLDLAATVRRLRAGKPADQQAVRIATAELTACRIDPALLDGVPGLRLRVDGAFATDSTIAWARSIAADPVAACAAVRR